MKRDKLRIGVITAALAMMIAGGVLTWQQDARNGKADQAKQGETAQLTEDESTGTTEQQTEETTGDADGTRAVQDQADDVENSLEQVPEMVRFCKWLVYPTYDNGFNQKIAYTGGEVWVIRILAIVAVLFIVGILMVIIMETIKQYKKRWNEISQMFLIGSLSGIAVLGDVIRGYLPVNLILLFVFVNMGINWIHDTK